MSSPRAARSVVCAVLLLITATGGTAVAQSPGLTAGSAHVDVSGAVSASFDAPLEAGSSSEVLPDGPLVAVFRDASGRYVLVSATTTVGPQQQPVVRVAPNASSDYGGYPTDGCAVDVISAGTDGISGTFTCATLKANGGTDTVAVSGTFRLGAGPLMGAPSPGSTATTTSSSPSADACGLISLDELKAATDVELPAGNAQAEGSNEVCEWSGGGVSVALYVQPRDPNVFASQKQSVGTPVTGIGDDAYSVAGPAQLYVLRGTTMLSILVTGAAGDPTAIEIQLAKDALARL